MNTRRLIVLLLAAVAAAGAAFLMRGFLGGGTKTARAMPPQLAMADVLVAAVDIAPGKSLDASMVRWQKWPKKSVSPSFLIGGGDAATKVKGTVARSPMVIGEPLSFAKIVKSEGAGFMAASLRPGMRAVSIPVSVTSVAGGFIQPGDRVDVMLASNKGNKSVKADTVLEDLRVLAIDQTNQAKDDKPVKDVRTATLEVTPDDGEKLLAAQVTGMLSLALRPLGERPGSSDVKIVSGLPPGFDAGGRKRDE